MTTMTEARPLLRPHVVARLMDVGVPERTAYRYSTLIENVEIGHSRLYSSEAVEAWIRDDLPRVRAMGDASPR
jgi:hypothetical protein